MLVHTDSLAATLDALDEALFNDRKMPTQELEAAARWLAGRQAHSGQWAGMFVPTELDYRQGMALFSGERLHTRLGVRNVLTAQAARVLALCDGALSHRADVLTRADRWLASQCFARDCMIGECGHSAIALMRYIAVHDGARAAAWLDEHLAMLAQRRDGKGRWTGLPSYYVLLALGEIDRPLAYRELAYAQPACVRALKRLPGEDLVTQRRRAILLRVLDAQALPLCA
jgi:hypothetical protein